MQLEVYFSKTELLGRYNSRSPGGWQARHEPPMCLGSKVTGGLLLVPNVEMPRGSWEWPGREGKQTAAF